MQAPAMTVRWRVNASGKASGRQGAPLGPPHPSHLNLNLPQAQVPSSNPHAHLEPSDPTLALASPHLKQFDLGRKTQDQLAEVRTRPVSSWTDAPGSRVPTEKFVCETRALRDKRLRWGAPARIPRTDGDVVVSVCGDPFQTASVCFVSSRRVAPETGRTLNHLLRICYPFADPVLDSIDDIARVVETATKYEMKGAIARGAAMLNERCSSHQQALKTYVAASRLGLVGVAQRAARATLSLPLGSTLPDDLRDAAPQTLFRYLEYRRRAHMAAVSQAVDSSAWWFFWDMEVMEKQWGYYADHSQYDDGDDGVLHRR